MNSNYLVSVIVATYRREFELKRAIESLITQTYKNIEIIIVDDNANLEWNQKVVDIVNEIASKTEIPITHLINEKNLGSARTRNRGIDASKGEYITFLDDDDVYLADKIKNQLYPMLDNNADFSITDLSLYNEKDNLVEVRKRDYIKETTPEKLFEYHLMYHMTGTDTLMFKKSYLVHIGGFDLIDIGDEFYLMCKAIQSKGKFIYVSVNDIKAYVHSNRGGLSSGQGKIDGENELFEYKKKFFIALDKTKIRYIKMRHYLVLAYALKRMKKNINCLLYVIIAFMVAPVQFLIFLKNIKDK